MENVIKHLGDEVLMNAALERVKAEMAALKPDELQPISLDISAAVATVLGVLPEVRALRERMVTELPAFNVARFDKLEDYAFALNFAHAKYLSATQPPDDLIPVAEQSAKARERLLAEANALVLDGVIAEAQLGQLKGANGYKNTATDLAHRRARTGAEHAIPGRSPYSIAADSTGHFNHRRRRPSSGFLTPLPSSEFQFGGLEPKIVFASSRTH